jgi:MFS family permease
MQDSGRKKWFALALILTVQFMTILDIAIVNVALPSIQLDLGFSESNLQWVISAYASCSAGSSSSAAARPTSSDAGAFHGRDGPLHSRLLSAACLERDGPHRVTCASGSRRGNDHAGRAVDPRRDLQGGP